jgi:hypothetical protein
MIVYCDGKTPDGLKDGKRVPVDNLKPRSEDKQGTK